MHKTNKYRSKKTKYTIGFTLIEILIALFIFSLITLMTMRGLSTTMEAKRRSQQSIDTVAEIQLAYTIMHRDIEQIINRNVLTVKGDTNFAFITPVDNITKVGTKSGLKTESGYNRMEFTRVGNDTTMLKQKVTDLLRVAYFIDNKMLVRHSWRQTDPVETTLVDKRRILSNIEQLEIFYINDAGEKLERWESKTIKNIFDPSKPSVALPRGLIIKADIKEYGAIEWVFTLPGVYHA